jgi:hypothetical protein
VKRAEEKKRHERRPSTSVAVKQEASDKDEKNERDPNVGEDVNPFGFLSCLLNYSSYRSLIVAFPEAF